MALLVLRRGALIHEADVNGVEHTSICTPPSVAEPIVSALVGIALTEGRIACLVGVRGQQGLRAGPHPLDLDAWDCITDKLDHPARQGRAGDRLDTLRRGPSRSECLVPEG